MYGGGPTVMNWIKCESKKARLLKGQGGGGGREEEGGRYDNVFTVSTLRRIECAIIKKKKKGEMHFYSW